jgi:hypothetical protein
MNSEEFQVYHSINQRRAWHGTGYLDSDVITHNRQLVSGESVDQCHKLFRTVSSENNTQHTTYFRNVTLYPQ